MRTPLAQVKQGRVLTDLVTTRLREAILSGYFEPGERLDQDAIAEQLDVSRTPIREAIAALGSEGLPFVFTRYLLQNGADDGIGAQPEDSGEPRSNVMPTADQVIALPRR